jgi:hypothetical protein
MFIHIKHSSGDRFRFVRIVRAKTPPDDGQKYIRPQQIQNLKQKLPGSKVNLIAILKGYAQYVPDCIVRVSDGVYKIDIDIDAIKTVKLRMLSQQTREYITSDAPHEKRMPIWRQHRWRDYIDKYEAKKASRQMTMSPIAQTIYSSMIDTSKGETEDSVYRDAVAAFQWIMDCLQSHDAMEKQIEALTDIEEALRFDITKCQYPPWINV